MDFTIRKIFIPNPIVEFQKLFQDSYISNHKIQTTSMSELLNLISAFVMKNVNVGETALFEKFVE